MTNYSDFNSKRNSELPVSNNFVDLTDRYANAGMRIGFQHEPTGEQVYFKAFIKAYTETFSSDYVSEAVFGRIDPIHTFKQTTRNISLTFAAPASTVSEGYDNMNRLNKLRAFLYPTYVDHNNALTINQNPLVRMTVMNMFVSQAEAGGYTAKSYSDMFSVSSNDPVLIDAGVGGLGIITNLSINYNIDSPEVGAFQNNGGGYILSKLLEITIDFKVIHEDNVAWVNGSTKNIYGLQGSTGTGVSDEVPPGQSTEQSEAEQTADGEIAVTEGTEIEEGSSSTIDSTYAEDPAGAEASEAEAEANSWGALEGSWMDYSTTPYGY